MSSVQYPFIDIAVHERIRPHFAAGKALVLFSTDMSEVVWANGQGALLFGSRSIYDLIDQGPNRSDLTYRQALATARGLSAQGDQRTFVMRMTKGFERIAVTALCERIRLPNNGEGILLAIPAGTSEPQTLDCARRMLDGFDDPQTHVAVLDADAQVISASSGFAALELSPQTARMLVNLAANDRDRLVKRPVPTALGYIPGAVARLSDDPPLNLLFLVQPDMTSSAEPEPANAETAMAVLPSSPAAADFQDVITAVSAIDELEDEAQEEDPFSEVSFSEDPGIEADKNVAETRAEAGSVPVEENLELIPAAADPGSMAATVGPDLPIADAPSDVEDQSKATDVNLTDNEVNTSPADLPETGRPRFQPDMRATRFVWKIDAEGRFREVSAELSAAVGPHAAEVVGLAFTHVAALFNLDPDGKILDLLNRRDTWSGKTIRWPIEGTALVVPIDLAALPTYTRNREFDGFRGFGIIRMTDLQEDPLAIGLTLARDAAGETVEPEADGRVEEPSVREDAPSETFTALPETDTHPTPTDDGVAVENVEQPANVATHTAPDAPFPAFHLPDTATDDTANAFIKSEDQPDDVTPDDAMQTASAEDDVTPATPSGSTDPTPSREENEPSRLQPPAIEKPVLRIVPGPTQRYSDKVVRFEERKPPSHERLSVAEQANFQEIARRLEAFRSERAPGDISGTADPADGRDIPGGSQTTSADGSPVTDAFSTEELVPPDEMEAGDRTLPSDDAQTSGDDSFPATAGGSTATDPFATEEGSETASTETHDPQEEQVRPGSIEDEMPLSLEEAYAQAIPVRQRAELSADIIDQMPVALLVHSGDQLIHANPEFLRLTGYDSLEALAEVGGLDALLQRHDLEDKTAQAGGMVVVRADDAVLPVTARLQSVRWEKSTALVLALMPFADPASTDQAPRHDPEEEAEKARQADERSRLKIEVDELRAILDTATDGVVIIGSDGEIRSMNRAASALFNYDNDETSGKPFVMLFAHESQKSVLDYLAGLSGYGVASLLNDGREVIGREASGGFVPLFMTIGHLTSSNGYCAVIRDITQWKRTEEELRNAKRAAETASAHKSEFLAHVSHEIRTPLNAIIGFADMMATERLGPVGHPRYIEYANDIGRSGRHVLDIVNDLLDISKIEAGEMDLDFSSVGLNETVAEAVSLVQPQANSQRVIIRTALSQSVPPVVADLRSIKQIVLNILSNAIRFTPSGGQIVVSTAYEANGSVVLRVRDTGIGMTRAELDLAMKPFRQVAGASRKRGDGTGLGLPLTKAMVDANRANFSIHSAPNEGTLVEVMFPSPRVLAN